MNSCLLQFIEMNVHSILVRTAGVGGKMDKNPCWAARQLAGTWLCHLGILRFSASFFTSQSPGSLNHRMWMPWSAVVEFLCKVPWHIIGIQIRAAMTSVIQWQISRQLKSSSNFWERGRPFRGRSSLKRAVYWFIIYFFKSKMPLEITSLVNIMNFSSGFWKSNIPLESITTWRLHPVPVSAQMSDVHSYGTLNEMCHCISTT